MDSVNTSPDDQSIQPPGQMPMVTGMRLDIAEALINLAIPNPHIVIEHGGTHAPTDTVTAQRPPPGAVPKPGSQVTLSVSVQP